MTERNRKLAKKPSAKIDRWIKRHEGRHFCLCGCGLPIKIKRSHYRTGIPKIIKGHNFVSFNPSHGLSIPKEKSSWETLTVEEKNRRLSNLKSFPKGENHPNWIGGEILTEHGYVLVREEHPFSNDSYVQQHRLIVEEWMRCNFPEHEFMVKVDKMPYLKKSTIVHHRDEIKDNNELDNLIIMRSQGIHLSWHRSELTEKEKLIKYDNDIFCPWVKKDNKNGYK